MLEIKNKIIVVWFSCGAASAVAAKLTIDTYGKNNTILLVNNPILNEHSDNLRFKKEVSMWLGYPILHAINEEFSDCDINTVFKKRKYISGVYGAPCTLLLKKEARYKFELKNNIDYHVLGFTLEEKSRHDNFIKYERSNVLPLLIENRFTKQMCYEYLYQNDILPPIMYQLGFANSNCIGCVKATSASYWQLVRKHFPNIFQERAILSRQLNCKLVRYKGKRLFLDELPENARGNKVKAPTCSIFC